MLRRLFTILAICTLGPFAWAAGDFKIQLNAGAGLLANPDALAAFQRAAAEWEAWLSSPITIYLDADLRGPEVFDPNVIGAASFAAYTNDFSDINLDYTLVRNAMAARANRPGLEVLNYLPTTDQVQAHAPDGSFVDTTTIGIVRANQRALGLLSASDTRADGYISFNSGFTFDYDSSNGIDFGKVDFQTAAAHEIGHILGFLSDTDDFDRYIGIDSTNLTTLDLFRFPTAQQPKTFLEFQNFARTLVPGEESSFNDLTGSYKFSTGVSQGDGNQASHWQDDYLVNGSTVLIQPLIGIMDPTLPNGTTENVMSSDIRAMYAIGYDVVPEPGSAALLAVGAVLVLGHRRRAA